MTAQYKRNKIRSSAGRTLKRLARFALFGIILLLIPVFAAFLMRSTNPTRFTGVVEAESETVGPIVASRIVSVEVYPGQTVNPGDVLVRLEPTERTIDMAMNEARLIDYEQSLLRYRESRMQYRQALGESARKYRQLVEEAAVELEQEKMNLARDTAELQGLTEELARLQPLVDKRVVGEVELAGIRPRIAMLSITVGHYKPLIDALESRLAKTKQGLDEVLAQQQSADDQQPESPFEISLQKARKTYEEIAMGEPTLLRATKFGIVSRIQHQAGDVVAAGDPIIRITSKSSMHIIGLLPQSAHGTLNVGDRIAVSRIAQRSPTQAPLTAMVETLDPEVLDLLDPFNPAPRVPLRGRRVRLRVINEEHALVPGETVYLHASDPDSLLDSIKRCFAPGSGMRQQLLFTTSR